MPAANTDKLRKKKSFFQTTLNGGISAVDTSLTLNSASGLPTDTAVTLIIDRVDSNGDPTTTLREIVTGTVSGSVVSNLLRGEESISAKSHLNGAVVEMTWDAETWNDFVDAYLTEHNQDGTHKSAAVSSPIIAASGKTTPVNADYFGIIDTEAANVLKKLTFTNLKAFLKTYFDTLYFLLGGNNTVTGNNTFSGTSLFSGNMIAKLLLTEGQVINGKIVVTDTGSGLLLALKGLDGNDPSATNPVYFMNQGIIRSVTAALSVTAADGTGWFGSGVAAFAAKAIDYFAYLGYNATDGVVIGFSRIPSALKYADFSATTTNEKFCKISTITTAAATDAYCVIGRFEATLSAGAGFTWSVPTYDPANLVQRPIFETRTLTWAPTVDWTGTDPTTPTTTARYKIRGNSCKFDFRQTNTGAGSSNTEVNFTLPFVPLYSDASQTSLVVNGYGSTADSSGSATTSARPIIYGTAAAQAYVIFSATIAGRAAYCNGEYEI